MAAEVEAAPAEAQNGVESGELEVQENGLKAKMNATKEVVPEEEAAPVENGDAKVAENGTTENGAAENGASENGVEAAETNGVEAAAETNGVEPAAETNGHSADEVTAESPVEDNTPPKVILHMHPPVKTLPTTSMFCMKLETYMRMHNIPYESHYGYKVGKNGKVPWIEYKGERVCDSNAIVDFLNKQFEIEPIDAKLEGDQKHIARAVQVMLEENTYWALQYNRWIDNFAEFKKVIQPEGGGGIGFNVNSKLSQRKVRSGLDQHGLGRHTKDEIYAITSKDLQALSGLLGDKPYLFGESVSTVDVIAFSLVAQITQSGLDSPLSTLIDAECKNLVEHFERMKSEYWSDWDDVVLGDRPVAPLKKGFSFRKKKNKKPKDGEAAGSAPEENGVSSDDATPAEGEAPAADAPATEGEATPAAETTETETPAETSEPTETPSEDTPAAETTEAETPAATETPAAESTDETPAAAATEETAAPAEPATDAAVTNGDTAKTEMPDE